jgi:peptidoglycan/LPS O-acetylase OafA/YrhL
LRERISTGGVSLPNFYIRRVLRLAPALLLVVALFIALGPLLLPIRWGRAWGDAAIALFYSANWTRAFGNRPGLLGHTWSLSVEEQFYFLWPTLTLGLYGWLGRSRRAGLLCLLAAASLTAWRYWMLAHGAPGKRVYNGLDTHGDGLLYGAAIAFLNPRLPRRLAVWLGWAGIAGLVWFVASAGRPFGPHPYVFASLFTGALLVALLQSRGSFLDRILSTPVLVWIGTISYGLYLFHFPIMDYMATWKQAGAASVAAVGFPLAFVLATISFYVVERPCLRLKERFRFSKSVSGSKPVVADLPLVSA